MYDQLRQLHLKDEEFRGERQRG